MTNKNEDNDLVISSVIDQKHKISLDKSYKRQNNPFVICNL